jgi:hypothetical protein
MSVYNGVSCLMCCSSLLQAQMLKAVCLATTLPRRHDNRLLCWLLLLLQLLLLLLCYCPTCLSCTKCSPTFSECCCY